MGSMGSIGSVSAKFEASTGTFTADIAGVSESLGKAGMAARRAGEQVKVALGDMTIAAQKERFAAMMASDATVSGLGKSSAAHERALRAWEREKLAQDRAAETAAAVGRANELAALKADILARANARLGDSTVPVITKFRVMSSAIRESLAGVGESMAATAERAELSADGMASAFGGLGKLIGVGIAGDMVAHMLDNFAELNVRLGDLHEKTGVAVGDLAGLRLAALSKGLNFETIGMGLTRMGRAMYEAKQGMLEDKEAFASLGISMKEVNTLSVEQMFYRISKALGENKSLTIADGTALELFGRGGKELIPVLRQWGGNLQSVVKEQAALTGVTDQSVSSSQKWLQATVDLSAELHGDLAPALIGLVKHLGAIEAAARGVWEVFLVIGGTGVAAFESIANAIHGPAAAMDDAIHGRWSAAAADTQNFGARIRQDWKDLGSVLRDNENKMTQDWAASGKLPKVEDVPDQNKEGDVAGHTTRGRGRGGNAAAAQMEGWKQNLESLKAAHAMSLGEEADYWLRAASTVKFGSKNYLAAFFNANRAMATLREQTATALAKFRKTADGPVPQEDLSKKYERYLSQQGHTAAQYLEKLNAGIAIQRQNADALAESSLQMEVATGRMSRYDAAVMAARLHTQEYTQSMTDLRDALAAVAADPSLTPIERRDKAAGIANQMARLNGQRAPQMMQDRQDLGSQSLGSASREALDEMVASWTDMTEQLRDVLPNALANIDESLSRSLMARAYNGQEYRRGIEQGLSNTARSAGSQLLNTGFHGIEGGLLSKLGLGPKAKIGESESSAMWVRLAGSGPSKSPAVRALLGESGIGSAATARNAALALLHPSRGSSDSGSGDWDSFFSGAKDLLPDGVDVGGGSGDASNAPGGSVSMTKNAPGGWGKTVQGIVGTALGMLAHFADGGSISSNLPSIVGERGPELFVPSSAGHIVPNDQLGMGGDTHHHTWNIDARGSNDPAQMVAIIDRYMKTAGPQIASAAMRGVKEHGLRKPSSAR